MQAAIEYRHQHNVQLSKQQVAWRTPPDTICPRADNLRREFEKQFQWKSPVVGSENCESCDVSPISQLALIDFSILMRENYTSNHVRLLKVRLISSIDRRRSEFGVCDDPPDGRCVRHNNSREHKIQINVPANGLL
jgi:hypothetical protein